MADQGTPQSREDILQSFKSILKAHEASADQIVTTSEQAQRDANRAVAETVTGYTVDGIVKTLAELQLSFSKELEGLSNTLEQETVKLSNLRTAISVESERLKMVRNVKVAAEALNILKRSIADRQKDFEEKASDKREELEDEIRETKEAWQKEAESFEASVKEYNDKLTKDRERQEEEFGYDLERQRAIDKDRFEEKKRLLERELSETEAAKEKDWAERAAVLEENAEEIEELRAKTEAFPAELEEKVNKAREDAIRKTNAEAKVEMRLLEKEIEANTQVYELKITSLENTIEQQSDEIQKLLARLEKAQEKAQNLAVKAIEGAAPNKTIEA